MKSKIEAILLAVVFAVTTICLSVLVVDRTAKADDSGVAAVSVLPPRYVVGVALYGEDGRLVNILLGKEMFLSMASCKSDMRKTVEKPTAEGKKVVGFCLPVPTLSQDDLRDPDGV